MHLRAQISLCCGNTRYLSVRGDGSIRDNIDENNSGSETLTRYDLFILIMQFCCVTVWGSEVLYDVAGHCNIGARLGGRARQRDRASLLQQFLEDWDNVCGVQPVDLV